MIRPLSTLAIVFSLILAAIRAQAAQPQGLLDRVGRQTAVFWDEFSAITCTEAISQKKFAPNGKTLIERRAAFDYLILLQLAGDELMVEESRLLQGKAAKESDKALLTTSGFSTLLLVAHPLYQSSYAFEQEPDETATAGKIHKLRFEHIRGRRSPSVLQLRNRDYPIEWRGRLWIDAATSSVIRIEAELKSPMDDIGLQKLASDVRYAALNLKGASKQVWMPQFATVEAATKRQRWINTHQFTQYRQFGVETDVRIQKPIEKDSVEEKQ